MKKTSRIALTVILSALAAGFILPALAFGFVKLTSDNLSGNDIFKLVQTNEASLRGMGERVLAYDVSKANAALEPGLRGIRNISADGGCVYFSCGGAGLSSATSYYGSTTPRQAGFPRF